jgi:lysophospholipase L1-like esterase
MCQPKTVADLPEAANPISREILVSLYDEQAPEGAKTHKRPLGELIDAAKGEATDPAVQIGGWQPVATLAEREALPAERRRPWMAVAVTETDTVYALIGGLGNDAWVPLIGPDLALLPTLTGAVAAALGDWRGGGSEGLADATVALQTALAALAARAGVLEAGQAAGGVAYATRAELEAATAPAAGTPAWVTNDPADAAGNPVNGFWRKTGETGEPGWQREAGGPVDRLRAELLAQLLEVADRSGYDRSGWAYALVDSQRRIALGVRKDGTVVVKDLVLDGTGLLARLEAVYDEIDDRDLSGKVLLRSIANRDYAYAIIDKDGRLGFGLRRDGTGVLKDLRLAGTSLVAQLAALAAANPEGRYLLPQIYPRSGLAWAVVDQLNRLGVALDKAGRLLVAGGGAALHRGHARSGWAYAITDRYDRIVFGIARDGEVVAGGVKLSQLGGGASAAALADLQKHVHGNGTIACPGDSLTAGAGASGNGYPVQLAALLGRTVTNMGVGGQNSSAIATRQGGYVNFLTVAGNEIPASGGVAVTAWTKGPITSQGPGPITGTLGGVPGTLSATFDGSGNLANLTFTRATAGSAVAIDPATPFLVDTFGRDFDIQVFWYGRNDFPTGVSDFATAKANVKAALAASIAYLKPLEKKFVVLSVINRNIAAEYAGQPTYQAIVDLNEELKALYPRHFLDVRRLLVRSYDPEQPQDVIDFGNDIPPTSLSSDGLHLNAAGYGIVAQAVANFITAKGW